MTEFKMPSLGADMDAGTLYEWFIKPGGVVRRGDVVASVETDKGVIDVECFEEGVVGELLVAAGTRVPVGQTIAVLLGPGEAEKDDGRQTTDQRLSLSAEVPIAQASPASGPPSIGVGGDGAPPSSVPAVRLKVSPAARKLAAELGVDLQRVIGTGADGAIQLDDVRLAAAARPAGAPPADLPRVTPVARRVAEEKHVDLHGVQGTGPHGVVSRADVEHAAGATDNRPQTPDDSVRRPVAVERGASPVAPEAVPPPEVRAPSQPDKADFAATMRRAIALAMARSNRDIPHYYLETRIDMAKPLRWLEAENAKRSLAERILPVVLLIKATARALVEVPDLNGYWRNDHLEASEAIHIGFAISLRQGGLVTPAIHDADEKSLDELMAAMRDLITRTRGGRLRSSELTDATVTLTSLGDTGVEKVYGVIYPPQVALVGFGKIMDQPWADSGMLGVRPILTATLAGDHRASDGRRGAQFLSALDKFLQEPEVL